MTAILKADESGALTVPAAILPKPVANAEYRVSVEGNNLIIRPALEGNEFWSKLSPRERAEKFSEWVERSAVPVGLSDYAVSRESIYED